MKYSFLLIPLMGFLFVSDVNAENELVSNQLHFQIIQEPPLERYEHARRHSALFYLSWKAVEILELDEETIKIFIPVFVEFNRSKEHINREKRLLSSTIRAQSKDNSVPIGEIRENIRSVGRLDDKMREERSRFLNRAKGILNERQIMVLTVMEDIMKDEIMNTVPFGTTFPLNHKDLEQRWRLLEKVFEDNKL